MALQDRPQIIQDGSVVRNHSSGETYTIVGTVPGVVPNFGWVLLGVREVGAPSKVVLKVVRSDRFLLARGAKSQVESLEKVRREAHLHEVAGGHPNVVSLYEHFMVGEDYLVLVMEYVNGSHLRDQRAGMSRTDVLTALCQVAEALEHVHETGIVHRDIKQSNVIWDPVKRVAKLIDFGIAGSSGARLSTAIAGTLDYLPPEKVEQSSDGGVQVNEPAADIFAYSLMAHEMLCGERPFRTHADQFRGNADRLPEGCVDSGLATLIHRGLGKNPRTRPSAHDFVRALKLASGDLAPPVRGAGEPDVAQSGFGLRTVATSGLAGAILGGALVVVVVVAVGVAVEQMDERAAAAAERRARADAAERESARVSALRNPPVSAVRAMRADLAQDGVLVDSAERWSLHEVACSDGWQPSCAMAGGDGRRWWGDGMARIQRAAGVLASRAEEGDPLAQLVQAWAYQEAPNRFPDALEGTDPMAFELISSACGAGLPTACAELWQLKPAEARETDDATELVERCDVGNDGMACNVLGLRAYHGGDGTCPQGATQCTEGLRAAENLFSKACQTEPLGCWNLARRHADGDTGVCDYSREHCVLGDQAAIPLLNQAWNRGHHKAALYKRAKMALEGRTTDCDWSEPCRDGRNAAAEDLRTLCDRGDARSCRELADLMVDHEVGCATDEDCHDKALGLRVQACVGGEGRACDEATQAFPGGVDLACRALREDPQGGMPSDWTACVLEAELAFSPTHEDLERECGRGVAHACKLGCDTWGEPLFCDRVERKSSVEAACRDGLLAACQSGCELWGTEGFPFCQLSRESLVNAREVLRAACKADNFDACMSGCRRWSDPWMCARRDPLQEM